MGTICFCSQSLILVGRLGWRWAFLIQMPLFFLSFILTTYHLNYATQVRTPLEPDFVDFIIEFREKEKVRWRCLNGSTMVGVLRSY